MRSGKLACPVRLATVKGPNCVRRANAARTPLGVTCKGDTPATPGSERLFLLRSSTDDRGVESRLEPAHAPVIIV